MPVSKKTRKKGTVKKSAPRTYFTMNTFNRESLNLIINAITRAEIAIEQKLHRGECSHNDFGCVRDVMDAAQIALLHRKCFDQETVNEFVPLFIKGTEAIYAVARRAQERNSDRLTCTAEEIEAIRDYFIPAAQLVKDSFEECPRTMLHEWELMLKLHVRATDKPFVVLSRAEVRKEIQSMVGNAGHYIKKRYQNA